MTWARRVTVILALAAAAGTVTSLIVAGWCAVACRVSSDDFTLGRFDRDQGPCDFVRIYRRPGVRWTEWWHVGELPAFFGTAADVLLEDGRVKDRLHHLYVRPGAWPRPSRLVHAHECEVNQGCFVVANARGWPAVSLQRLLIVQVPYVMTYDEAVSLHPPHEADVVVARTRPVWGGLLVNTLVYGAAWLVIGWVVWKGRQTALGSVLLWTIASLVVGVATTVGIAWGLAYFGAALVDATQAWPASHRHELWEVDLITQRDRGALRITSEWADRDVVRSPSRTRGSFGTRNLEWARPDMPDWAQPLLPQGTPSSGMVHDQTMDARGWPWLALVGTVSLDRSPQGPLPKPTLRDAIHLPIDSATPQSSVEVGRLLPLAPVWRGFTLNTLVFASVVWALGVVAFLVRRVLRRARGRCPRCAYVLTHERGGGCPECGWRRVTAPT